MRMMSETGELRVRGIAAYGLFCYWAGSASAQPRFLGANVMKDNAKIFVQLMLPLAIAYGWIFLVAPLLSPKVEPADEGASRVVYEIDGETMHPRVSANPGAARRR